MGVLAGVLLLGGCASGSAEREARLRGFIGRPVGALIRALGVPSRSYTAGGVTYLAYVERHLDLVPPAPIGPPWIAGWYGSWAPPQAVERVCETTFAVTDDVVRSFSLHGNAC